MKFKMNTLAPEELELNKKRRVLERLKERLADREEEMADLRAELELFEGRYKIEVARYYADLDEIEALIAEEELKLVPDDEDIKRKVEEYAAGLKNQLLKLSVMSISTPNGTRLPKPKSYHNLARIIHRFSLDSDEKEKRHVLMTKLNEAYSSGDQNLLNKLVEDFRDSPDLVRGDTVGDELVRAIRQIFQIKKRLVELKEEKLKAELSETYVLREKAEAEMRDGRDMLAQMAARTKVHIQKSKRRLENLRNLNVAQEDYVKEAFGLDISEFREK